MLPNETRFGRLSEIQDEIMGFTMEQVGDKEAYAKLVFCRNLGSLTVGQGRSYLPGSFTLTLRTLGELTGGMLE
ncbi:hypothetical protein C5E12_07335, partial [Rathayibacter rathayi]|uniref:hypothetical protein n=1 Tax=Rathayibacter rathayi TaxID=33887 RepID=UPI000D4A1B81